MLPISPNPTSFSQNQSHAAQDFDSINDSRLLLLAKNLIASLEKHEQSLKKNVSKKKQKSHQKNIIKLNTTIDIHQDCNRIHELCLLILSKNFQLIEDQHLIKIKNSLLSIESELKHHHKKDTGVLEEIKNEIEDLENAINWTKKISDQFTEKATYTSQNKSSFWKTFLKAAVFSSLIAKADTPPLHPPLINNIQKYEPLQSKMPDLALNVSQLGLQHIYVNSTESSLSINTTLAPEHVDVPTNHENYALKNIYDLIEVQHLSNFISNSTIPINNQLLFHLVGDYGGDTQLEGGNTVKNLEYLLNIFDQELYHLDLSPADEEQKKFFKALFENTRIETGTVFSKPTLEKLREQVQRAFVIGHAMSGDFSDFYNIVTSQIKALTPNDSFFFPFNWPKHALACEIIKETEQSYVVRFYNTGEGAEEYSEIYTQSGLKRLPFVEVIGVKLENLENFAFFNALWKLSNSNVVDKPQKILSDQILPSLKGLPSNRQYSAEEHLTPQRTGTCSMKVLSGVLCQLVSDTQQCHQLNWKLNLKAISNFYQQHQSNLHIDIISRNNLRKGLTEFTVLSQDLKTKNQISAQAFHYASDLINDISKTLDSSELSYEKTQQENRLDCEITASPAVLPAMPNLGKNFKWWDAFTFPAPLTIEGFSFDMPTFTTNGFVTELQTVLAQLDIPLKDKITKTEAIHRYELSMLTINNLPSPTSNFWSSLPIDNIPEAIEKLTDLEFNLAFSVNDYVNINNNELYTPSGAIVNVMKLIAIMNALVERVQILDVTLPPLNLYQKSFEEIFENKNPWISALSPTANNLLKNIKDYWIQRKPKGAENSYFVSIFGIEAAPPTFGMGYDFLEQTGIELFADNEEIRRNHGYRMDTNSWGEDVLKYCDWQFQKWAEEYLKNHPKKYKELQETLLKQFPHDHHIFDNIKTLAIFSLVDKMKDPSSTEENFKAVKVLPNFFYKLRDASFIADYFFKGFIGQNGQVSSLDRQKLLTWSLTRSNKKKEVNKYILEISHKLYNSEGSNSELYDLTWSGKLKRVRSIPSGLTSFKRLAPSREINNIWSKYGKERFRLSPEEIRSKHPLELGLSKETIEKYGIERTRNLLTLSSIKELQIFRTLSYFSQDSNFLDTEDGKWLFENLVFEPLILREALMQGGSHVRLLLTTFQNFIHQQYQSISMNDSKIIFLIRIHRRFQQEVQNIHAHHPEYISGKIQKIIPDARTKISELLQSSPLSNTLRTALSQELAISYSYNDSWDEKSLVQFLKAHVTTNTLGEAGLIDILSNLEQRDAINHQLQNLFLFFKENHSIHSILNQVVKAIIPNMPDLVSWQPYNYFPVFIGSAEGCDTKYYIDILSGKISDSTGSISLPPPYTHPIIVKLREKFPNTEFTAVNSYQWSFTPATNEEYRIQHQTWRDQIIQKKISNKWYQLNQDEALPMHAALTRNNNLWLSLQEGEERIIIENNINDKPLAFGFNSLNQLKIYKADEAGKPTNWIYENVWEPTSQMHFLTDIEMGSEIIFWRDATSGVPKELNLPRLGLQFKVQERNGKFIFISDALGGYAIAKEQHIDALADAKHYLVLEKGNEKKIIIPRIPYASIAAAESSLNPIAQLDFRNKENSRYFTYQVLSSKSKGDPTQTKLISPHQEARFYLSMIHLWHHNYAEALQLLIDYGGQQKQYSVEEREILKWICRLNQNNKDATPEAEIVRLQALILLMRNERNYGFKQKLAKEISDISDISLFEDLPFLKESVLTYEKYLTHQDSWGQFQLKKDDEFFFLRELYLILKENENFTSLLKTSFSPKIFDSFYANLMNRVRKIKGKKLTITDISIRANPASPSKAVESITINYNTEGILNELHYNHNNQASLDILKPEFNEFDTFYLAVRNHDPALMKNMLQKLTGVEFNFINTEELTKALDQVLEFISMRTVMYKGRMPARLLRNILHYPISAHSPLPEKLFINFRAHHHNALKDDITEILKLTSPFEPIPSESKPALHKQSRKVRVVEETISPDMPKKTTPPHVLTMPKISNLTEFHINPEVTQDLIALNSFESLSATRTELANDINIQTNNTVANRVIRKLHEEISQYEGPAKAKSYSITNWPAMQELNTSISKEYASTSASLDQLTQQIETLIQKEPADLTERDVRHMEIAIKRKLPLNIDDAIYLYLRRSPQTFQELNPALNEADQNAFLALMHRYLIEKTNQQHRSRILKGISDIDKLQHSSGLKSVPQKLIDNLGRDLLSKRAYDPIQHPEYLVLEHFMEILFWDKQVKALDTLLIKNGKITAPENLGSAIELIMGSGKTDVLLPLICLLNADGKNLAIGVVPRVLLAENAAELSQRVGPAFRQTLDVMTVNQDTNLNLQGLVNLRDNLEYAVENRRIVMTSDSDIQGLFLKFADANIDAFHAQGDEKFQKITEIAQFRKIFRLLRTSGVPAFDESDTIFNAKLSQHQTKGDPLPLPDSFTVGTRAFILALGQQAIQAEPFQDEEELANHIAGVTIQANRGTPFEKNSLMANYLKKLSIEEKKLISAFFKGSNDPKVLEFVDEISKKHASITLAKKRESTGLTKGETIQDILAVIRGQISSIQENSSLASLIFSKKYRFDFAPPVSEEELDQVENVEDLLAIPHKKGNPSLGSKPGTELEEILYTYRQFLLRRQLPKTFFKNILEDLRTKTIGQSSQSSSIHRKIEDIPAYQELFLIFGNKLPASLKHPFDDTLVEASLRAHAADPARLTDFIHKYIIKQIEFYPYQINSNAQFYRFLFKKGSETAFSGTICNGESWPWLFGEDLHLSDTAIKTLTLMYQGPEKIVHSLNIAEAATVANALDKIYSHIPGSTSIIDAAGNVLKFDPKEVAMGMLAHSNLSKKTAVRYPDKKTGLWMEIERGKIESTLVDLSKLSPSEVAVYWPAPKTTGSDVRTAPDEITVVILGPNTVLRDIQQSLWRLREYDKGQTARYVIDSDDGEIIRQTLSQLTGKPLNGELLIKHILQNAVYKHALQVGDDNTRSLKLRFGAALMHQVWDKVLDQAFSDEEIIKIMHQAESLYLSKTIVRPYEMYGKPKMLRPREEVAKEWLENTFQSPIVNTFKQSEQKAILHEMNGISQKALPSLPSHVMATQHFGFEREVQVHTQKETHKETQTQTETDVDTDIDTQKDLYKPLPSDWKEELFTWSDENVFTEKYFSHDVSNRVFHNLQLTSQPIVSLDWFVKATTSNEFSPDYSSNVFSSLNLSPIHKYPHTLAKPYSRVQEYPRVFLVIQSPTDPNNIRSLLITETEEKRFRELLSKDQNNQATDKKELKIALYDLITGVTAESKDRINFTSLEENPEFLMQKIQLKFYAGISQYSKEEMPVLGEWIQSCGVENMKKYFKSVVLKGRTDSQHAFLYSTLDNLFKELSS